jgi:hypothetical protein
LSDISSNAIYASLMQDIRSKTAGAALYRRTPWSAARGARDAVSGSDDGLGDFGVEPYGMADQIVLADAKRNDPIAERDGNSFDRGQQACDNADAAALVRVIVTVVRGGRANLVVGNLFALRLVPGAGRCVVVGLDD